MLCRPTSSTSPDAITLSSSRIRRTHPCNSNPCMADASVAFGSVIITVPLGCQSQRACSGSGLGRTPSTISSLDNHSMSSSISLQGCLKRRSLPISLTSQPRISVIASPSRLIVSVEWSRFRRLHEAAARLEPIATPHQNGGEFVGNRMEESYGYLSTAEVSEPGAKVYPHQINSFTR